MIYDKTKSCCFTGHRSISKNDVKPLMLNLNKEIKALISLGVKDFWCGGALGFDTIAATYISILKEQGHSIRLILAVPCKDQNKYWNVRQKEIYDYTLSRADKIVFLSDEYTDDCMKLRNKFMVDHANFCICYLKNQRSGTGATVRYAKEKGLKIISLV